MALFRLYKSLGFKWLHRSRQQQTGAVKRDQEKEEGKEEDHRKKEPNDLLNPFCVTRRNIQDGYTRANKKFFSSSNSIFFFFSSLPHSSIFFFSKLCGQHKYSK